jgi:protein TonB
LITHDIRWFVVFSVAIHAAILTAWQPRDPDVIHRGRPVQLAVINTSAGMATASPESTDAQTRRPAAEQSPPPARQARATNRPKARSQALIPAKTSPATSAAGEARPVAAQTALATSGPALDRQEVERQLRDSILELVTKQLKYPAIARRKGWQGVVQLELHIEPDGRISRLHIDRTSGYPALDNAAVQALQFASLPQAKQWLSGQAVDLIVPVEYRLLEG